MFGRVLKLLSFVTIVILQITLISTYEEKLTLNVDAGTRECLYHDLENGTNVDVEYLVLNGNFDISFTITGPNNNLIAGDMRRINGMHRFLANTHGPYQFCLDNSYSRINRKLVYFNMFLDLSSETNSISVETNDTVGDEIEEFVEELKISLEKIRIRLGRSIYFQGLFGAVEARDRSIVEGSFERVNFWSAFHLAAMVISTVINVILIRKLFHEKREKHSAKLKT